MCVSYVFATHVYTRVFFLLGGSAKFYIDKCAAGHVDAFIHARFYANSSTAVVHRGYRFLKYTRRV